MGGYTFAQPIAGVGVAAGSPLLTGALTSSAIGLSSAAAASVTAGVGAIVGIGIQLLAAHELRKKQATTENSAVDAAVAGWDQAVAKLVAAYNSGEATATDLRAYLGSPQTGARGQLWQWYWQEVGPVIQPGRNGCMSGSVPHPGTSSFCVGGSYGAACCVAYDDLDNSSLYILQALNATEQDGQPHTANVLVVVGSKYGGQTRPAYQITLQKPSVSQQAVGTVTSAIGTTTQLVNSAGSVISQGLDAITGGTIVQGTTSPEVSSSNLIVPIIVAVVAALIVRNI